MAERKLLLTSPGSYENPADKPCWEYCTSCGRCEKKGTSACPYRNTCSGRFDPKGVRIAHPDDSCRCKEGVLQWVTQDGKLAQSRFLSNPFSGIVKYEGKTQDEIDWEDYLKDAREKLDDPDWDPIQFTDGRSTQRWFEQMHRGNQK